MYFLSAGAALIGVIALLQAYVFPGMIPIPPVK
jgi:lactate permease